MTVGGGTSTIHPLSKLRSGVAFGCVLLVPVVLIGVPVENGDFVDACLKKQCGDLFLLPGRECAFLMQNTVVGGAGIKVVHLPLQIHRFFVGDVVEKTADAPGITLFLGAAEVGAPVGFCGIVGGIHRHDVCHFGRDMLCGEMARAYAQAGAKVAALDLNEEAVKKLADELTAEGFICKGYKANVLDAEALEAVHQQVLADLGPCDILINGAGGNNPRATTDNEYQHEAKEGQKTFFDLEPNGVDFVFKLNFQGTLLPTQAFAKDMVARKSGNILNISSMNAYIPLTKIPAYSGAKAAISNFTQWLATHFAGTGIRANAIAPGFLVSNQNRALLFNADGTPTARSAKILNGTPMGRFVDSKELLGGVFFLTDDEAASAITGVVLPIDCGFAAYSGV